jgi:uncharacterized membrane protein
MALLRAELYHTLDDLKELSAHLPDADADGAWKYLPSPSNASSFVVRCGLATLLSHNMIHFIERYTNTIKNKRTRLKLIKS